MMNDTSINTLDHVRQFLNGVGAMEFSIEAKAARYTWMQATLLRSHVREEARAAEAELEYAISAWEQNDPGNKHGRKKHVKKLLKDAIKEHRKMKKLYDAWNYKAALFSAMKTLSLVDQALTAMDEPDRIHDPIEELGLGPFP